MIDGDVPFYVKIWRLLTHPPPLQNADFQSIFARSVSAVTPSKEVQLTLIGSPLRAFQ